MIRRFLALLLTLVTLNVSAAEALRVCANQQKHATKHDGCEKPAPAKAPLATCCDALATCGFTLALDGASIADHVVPDAAPVMLSAAIAPATQTRSPEPPPPKGLA
jgi:hypothetical protein